ncbi:gliding motility-associated C-terminal domain-containing protein [Fluviicola taffensis]|uniref:T9SS type B sorting domain-containing protein n=1 Tax=Fluviicola taffensis TaxID=191579 RepID=UPI003138272F
MKNIALLILFLFFGGILFAQQTADSCVIVVPTNLQKEGRGDQQVHFRFTSTCSIQDIEITIFNRWGEKLHVSTQLEYDLSGKITNQGTYYYVIKGAFSDRTKINQTGYFTIL